MTEQEWLDCSDPFPMVDYLGDRLSQRKLRLFGCACVRTVWEHLPDQCLQQAIETCERFADGLAEEAELQEAEHLADSASQGVGDIIADHSAIAVSALCGRESWFPMGEGFTAGISAVAAEAWFDQETPWHVAQARAKQAHCELLREVIGNPFRGISLNPAYQTANVVALAQAAYEQRLLPPGTLDVARLAVLADALEDAGCTDANILNHLRGPGPHVRGCFVLDKLLGKK